jgi:hypothetical protein
MPTLAELRKRNPTLDAPRRIISDAESLIFDQRGELTPKQMVESKLGNALARVERQAAALQREQQAAFEG